MDEEDKLKIYMAWTESSRKWVSVMDAKAAFLCALNAGLLGFIWTGGKLIEVNCLATWPAMFASIFALISLFCALLTVLPRGFLSKIFGKHIRYADHVKPVSFYGFVASHYPLEREKDFFRDVASLDAAALSREALEQHYTISHTLQIKSNWIGFAANALMLALLLTMFALMLKVFS